MSTRQEVIEKLADSMDREDAEAMVNEAFPRSVAAVRSTHTYALLDVSAACWQEIHDKLYAAGYSHAFHADEAGTVIDMHGIGLHQEPQSATEFTKVLSAIDAQQSERNAFDAGHQAGFDDLSHSERGGVGYPAPPITDLESWIAAGRPMYVQGYWMRQFVSTHIASAGWRRYREGEPDGIMCVRFFGGALGTYDHVSETWWVAFLKADSKGKFIVGVKKDPAAHPWTVLEAAPPKKAKALPASER